MKFHPVSAFATLFLASALLAPAHGQLAPDAPPQATQATNAPVDDAAQEQLLQQAVAQIKAGKNAEAIQGPLASIIQTYEAAYAQSPKRIYCAVTMTETLLYLATAANHHENAQVLGKPTWALAYYLRGYAYGALGDNAGAEANLKQALALSPSNSQFLSELGNVYQNRKDWPKALKVFQDADTAADMAPPVAKVPFRCRALRGQGYVLVELHQLDDAAQKYQACLSINPGDPASTRELGYVKGLQQGPAQPAATPLDPKILNAVAMYGRAQAFHDIVQAQHCGQIDQQAMDAINLRFDSARAQLSAHLAPRGMPPTQPLPPSITSQPCDRMTIESYGNHVREFEQYLSNLDTHG